MGRISLTSPGFAARAAIGIGIALIACVPMLSHAQTATADAMSATIRVSIMKDPRSASLSPAQIDAMAQALSSKARAQGVTVEDLTYVPGTKGVTVPGVTDVRQVSAAPVDPCAADAWCALGERIGSGLSRNWIYAAFWVLSLMLIVTVWLMRKNIHIVGGEPKPEMPAIGGKI